MAELAAEKELGALAAEQATAPAQTSVAVATTAPTNTTPYGYTTSAQAAAIVTAVNALVVDVAALVAYIGTIHTAANAS